MSKKRVRKYAGGGSIEEKRAALPNYTGVGSTKAGALAQLYRDETGWSPPPSRAFVPAPALSDPSQTRVSDGIYKNAVPGRPTLYSQGVDRGVYDPQKELAEQRDRGVDFWTQHKNIMDMYDRREKEGGVQVFGMNASGSGIEGSPEERRALSERWMLEDLMKRDPRAAAALMNARAAIIRAETEPKDNRYKADRAAQASMYGADRAAQASMYGADAQAAAARAGQAVTAYGHNLAHKAAMRGHEVSRENSADATDRALKVEQMRRDAEAPYKQALIRRAEAETLLQDQQRRASTPTIYDAKLAPYLAKLDAGLPLDETEAREYSVLLAAQHKARGFASGGPVTAALDVANNPMLSNAGAVGMGTPRYDPQAVSQYGQYLYMAKTMGLPPLPFEQFLESRTAAMAQAAAAQRGGVQVFADGGAIPRDRRNWFERLTNRAQYKNDPGYQSPEERRAQQQQQQHHSLPNPLDLKRTIDRRMQAINDLASGGEVPVAGRQVIDPNHGGEVDSIPAVIDGTQKAALNSGEMVIPSDVVRALGTEYFNKLIDKYHKSTAPTPTRQAAV